MLSKTGVKSHTTQQSRGKNTRANLSFYRYVNTVKCCSWNGGKTDLHLEKVGAKSHRSKNGVKSPVPFKAGVQTQKPHIKKSSLLSSIAQNYINFFTSQHISKRIRSNIYYPSSIMHFNNPVGNTKQSIKNTISK